MYDVETWTLGKEDQKHLERFEMWYWRMMGKNTRTDHVINEKVLHSVKEDRNVLHAINTES